MQALTVVAECVPQVGIEDKQRTVQIHEWESDWNPNCNILETDRPQHDRPATCVIAQQYSSAAVIPLHFQSREENLGAFGECYYLTFFNLFSSAYVWNCGTLNCVIRWAFLYFRYLRTGISGIYVSVFQVSTYRYFRYLPIGISGIYVPVFQVSTYRYFRYLRIGISGIYVPVFPVSTYRYFRYLRTGILGIYVSVFQVSTYRYFRYLRIGISGIYVPVF